MTDCISNGIIWKMILNREGLARKVSEPGSRLDELIEKLREGNHRVTPQRLAILKILAASEGHPSVERVFQEIREDFPTTSLATVYKTIALLKEMGEVLELGFDEGNRYDGNRPYPHTHLICVECRAIVDADMDTLQALPQRIAEQADYVMVGHRFDIYGICPACQARGRTA